MFHCVLLFVCERVNISLLCVYGWVNVTLLFVCGWVNGERGWGWGGERGSSAVQWYRSGLLVNRSRSILHQPGA